jgi:pimeloyl-ACP methyl ester carboxylesterase
MKSILQRGGANICLILIFSLLSIKATAQNWDTLTWKSYADYRLQPLNKNFVTTGILYDRVFPQANIDEHVGNVLNADTTFSGHFMQSYYELYNAAYNTTGWLSPDNLNTILDTSFFNAHPIGILFYKFNTIDTNALQDNLMDTLSNGQFTDVANRPRSPYFTKTTFLASPLIAEDQVIEPGEHVFYIDEQFFLHNEFLNITQIRIDFGDGQGEWIVDDPFDNNGLRRSSTIVGSILKTIVTTIAGRITIVGMDLLGNGVLYGNPFKITVKNTKEYAALTPCKGETKMVIIPDATALAAINTQYGNPQLDYTREVEVPCPLPGLPGAVCKQTIEVKDTAYIYFAGNGSTCGTQIKRPIVFLDGFDPTNDRDVKKIFEDYINKGILRNNTPVQFGDYMLDPANDLTNSQGYDFIILDFKHGNDLLERNAMTVVKLLQDLYQTYGTSFEQEITIIGPSMGAMVAQYALAYMEYNNMPHHVKTFISFDGPHQGANVPIGLLNYIEYVTKKGIFSKLKVTKGLLREGLYNGLAARQLLAHHPSANSQFPAPDALRIQFLQNLAAVGEYPALTRNVAQINGMNNGTLNDAQFAGADLLRITTKRQGILGLCGGDICSLLDWVCKTTPNTGSGKVTDMWTAAPLFNVLLNVPLGRKNIYADAAWNNSAQDNSPGGRIGALFGSGLGGQIIESKLTFLIKDFMYLLLGSRRTTFYQNLNNFTFVPSYSGADLRFPGSSNNSNKDLYLDWSNENLCGKTPFDYIYSQASNTDHVAVTQSGSVAFENEIKCNVADLPVFFNPNIDGPSAVCSTATYSVSFCKPTNTSVTWSVDPSYVATVSSTGVVTRQSDGEATLTATITSCGSTTNIITKQIKVGTPSVGGTYFTNGQEQFLRIYSSPFDYNDVCNSENVSTSMQVSGASSVTWSKTTSNPTTVSWYQSGNNLNFYLWSLGQTALFKLQASNSCGTTSYDFGFRSIDCTGGGGGCELYSVSPNPASSSINVSVAMIPPPCDLAMASSELTISEVNIYDQVGNLMKVKKEKKSKKTTINLDGLKTGIYVVEIVDGKYKERHQIIITK